MSAVSMLVNNTRADLRAYEPVIWQAIRNGGKLPEELAYLLTLEIREVRDENGNYVTRAFIDFA